MVFRSTDHLYLPHRQAVLCSISQAPGLTGEAAPSPHLLPCPCVYALCQTCLSCHSRRENVSPASPGSSATFLHVRHDWPADSRDPNTYHRWEQPSKQRQYAVSKGRCHPAASVGFQQTSVQAVLVLQFLKRSQNLWFICGFSFFSNVRLIYK